MDIEPVFRIFKRFRIQRMRFFYQRFQIKPETKVLDVGGREFNWTLMPFCPRVTILNLTEQGERSGRFDWVIGDARNLPFPDHAFDVVYSNSVIEHLGNIDDQRRFASECRRVGRSYFVQTPNRRFPMEPHVLAPFIHWLPKNWQRPLVRNFTVWGWITRPSPERREWFLDTTRMLTEGELQSLFPEAEIRRERFLGLTKSLIAINRPAQSDPLTGGS